MRGVVDERKEVCFYIDDIDHYEKIKEWFQESGDWIFRAQSDAPWGNERSFENKKRMMRGDVKPSDVKFSLYNSPHDSIADILQCIDKFAQPCNRILRFFLNVDIAIHKMLEGRECKADSVVLWAIKKDRLIARMREIYPADSLKSESDFCINHAKHICYIIGRNVLDVYGVIPLTLSELGMDECLLIPCKGENFAKNLNAALSCDVSKLDNCECIHVDDKLDLSSCVIAKIMISKTLSTKLQSC